MEAAFPQRSQSTVHHPQEESIYGSVPQEPPALSAGAVGEVTRMSGKKKTGGPVPPVLEALGGGPGVLGKKLLGGSSPGWDTRLAGPLGLLHSSPSSLGACAGCLVTASAGEAVTKGVGSPRAGHHLTDS